MLAVMEAPAVFVDAPVEPILDAIVASLGGRHLLDAPLAGLFDVHRLLLRGLPGAALTYFVEALVLRHDAAALENAIGVSLRTLQRRKLDPSRPLSVEQSGRIWVFAEILARASAVFGGRAEAEAWLEGPAMGLDQHRPIELLATRAGAKLLEDHLERLEYGVYT